MKGSGSKDGGRLPDVIVPGFMKSGTTSLHRWLESCPEVATSRSKEPNFFSDDSRWSRGPAWYRGQICDGSGCLTVDSSTAYADPEVASVAARRAYESNPAAKIVFVVREPFERAISHVRHERQRGRERRDLDDLGRLLTPDSAYVRRSCYHAGASPWIDAFPAEAILVVSTASLNGAGWQAAVDHLGLAARPRPDSAFNETATKAPYRRLMTSLYRFDSLRRLERHVPRGMRQVARPLLLRRSAVTESTSSAAPAAAQELLHKELEAFADLITSRGIRHVR